MDNAPCHPSVPPPLGGRGPKQAEKTLKFREGDGHSHGNQVLGAVGILSNMATRWGICGAGKISHDWNVALKTLPAEDHQAVAVAARSLESAQDFAKKHGIPQAYGSYEELAKDPNIASSRLLASRLAPALFRCRPSRANRLRLLQKLCAALLYRDVVYLGVLHTQHLRVGLLFLNAGKNVLCEKPFAMNSREVKQLIAAAKKNNVFLMEGIWSRCFPVQREVSRLLSEEAVGEVKVVKAYFGSPQLHIPRSVETELGGGALLDIGVYCLQFVLMVFQGERPESIHATGHRLESGVDEVMIVVLKFSRNRTGLCGFSIGVPLPNDATISGTKGTIRIPSPMWCPSVLVVNGKETEYPLPEPCMPMNFTNSTGLRYEAEEVRQCLLKGLKESSRMPLADSVLLTEIMDEARRQVGVIFTQDNQ
ncbi:hypothetical protein ACEWY4_015155 [Coilia grayii]|uniref:Trans-1,2-dihydrobenzene-1,2-diol dehydrogenase n=1 Tax=Coilia grayii TaxID=363190 RepID=A0ABD1JM84_9TELE